MPTDEQCNKALEAMEGAVIQGFALGPDFTAPYVLRDINRQGQEIWRGQFQVEMMRQQKLEQMRLALAAVGL